MAGRRLSDASSSRASGPSWADSLGADSYYDKSTTRTKANTTLFVSFRDARPPVPDEQRAALAERMFAEVPGYLGVRQVRGMCFVDFETIKASTAAMMRYQGQKGVVVDYDKDVGVAGKRRRESTETAKRSQHEAQSASYYCAVCGTKALKTDGALLSSMPTRSTDGARVVDEGSALQQLLLDEPPPSAPPALVRRPKGVEKQYRLSCRSCKEPIAYRSVLAKAEGKYLYVHAAAVRERPPTADELAAAQSRREEPAPASAAPAPAPAAPAAPAGAPSEQQADSQQATSQAAASQPPPPPPDPHREPQAEGDAPSAPMPQADVERALAEARTAESAASSERSEG